MDLYQITSGTLPSENSLFLVRYDAKTRILVMQMGDECYAILGVFVNGHFRQYDVPKMVHGGTHWPPKGAISLTKEEYQQVIKVMEVMMIHG